MLVVVSLIARLPSRIEAARHSFRVTTLIGDRVLSRPDLAAPRRALLSGGRSLSTEVARFRLKSQMGFSAPTGCAQLPEATATKPHLRLRPSNSRERRTTLSMPNGLGTCPRSPALGRRLLSPVGLAEAPDGVHDSDAPVGVLSLPSWSEVEWTAATSVNSR